MADLLLPARIAAGEQPDQRTVELHETTPQPARQTGKVGRGGHIQTQLLGVRVDDVPVPALIERVANTLFPASSNAALGRLLVVNANAHLVMLARDRPWLQRFFASADIAFCDGAGVQLAIWLLTGHRPSRHTPPQWIEMLARRIAPQGGSVFWLGGTQEAASLAAERLEGLTGVRTAGVHHGYFDATSGSDENEAVVAAINAARPDIVLVNMGMPRQEQWLAENWHQLDARVAITAGALVDHMAGRVRRPPLWVANAGLEWAVRLAVEPRRLWRRYLLGLPPFAALVFCEKLKRLRTA